MIAFLSLFLHIAVSPFKTQARLEAAISVLRHQLNVLRRRTPSKPRLTVADRLIFVWLYWLFPSVLNAVSVIEPENVIRWHRTGFRLYWRWKSRSRGGRPRIPAEILRLIRDMSLANRLWDAPRIHGELLSSGSKSRRRRSSSKWRRAGEGSRSRGMKHLNISFGTEMRPTVPQSPGVSLPRASEIIRRPCGHLGRTTCGEADRVDP